MKPKRPVPGQLEQRVAPYETAAPTIDGQRLRGLIPYNTESRDMGGWKEVMDAGCLRNADLSDLVAVVDHGGMPLGRYPGTMQAEDGPNGWQWSVDLPESRADVREAVERGDIRAGSWRMVVKKDRWDGDVRHVLEVEKLTDVTVAGSGLPAYPQAAVEYRQTEPPQTEPPPEPLSRRGGGLRIEDRAGPARDVDAALVEAIRDVRPGESRVLSTAVSISPGELSTVLFDKLRSQSVVLSSGAIRILTTDSDSVTYPTVTVDTAPTSYAEGATITPGDPTLATVVAVPQKIAHLVQMNNELVDDSDPSVIQVVTDNLLRATAVKLDQQLIEGSGTPPQMTGLHFLAGVQTMAAAEILPDFDAFSDALALLEGVGGTPAGWFMASRTFAQIRKLKKGTGDVTPVLGAERGGPSQQSPMTLFGVPMFHSNQVSITDAPGTATAVHLVGEGAVVYVNRSSPVVELDRSRLFNSDQSELRVKTRGNLIAAIPNGIVRITGMLPG